MESDIIDELVDGLLIAKRYKPVFLAASGHTIFFRGYQTQPTAAEVKQLEAAGWQRTENGGWEHKV